MRDLPTGTVTLLFTDVEGSTRLLHDTGTRTPTSWPSTGSCSATYSPGTAASRSTRRATRSSSLPAAAEAAPPAHEGQRALGRTPVRVRMGLHTGEPRVTDEGYVGIDVHRAARVAACGHGGQIVVSETTRALLGDGRRAPRPRRASPQGPGEPGAPLPARRRRVPAAPNAATRRTFRSPPGRFSAASASSRRCCAAHERLARGHRDRPGRDGEDAVRAPGRRGARRAASATVCSGFRSQPSPTRSSSSRRSPRPSAPGTA